MAASRHGAGGVTDASLAHRASSDAPHPSRALNSLSAGSPSLLKPPPDALGDYEPLPNDHRARLCALPQEDGSPFTLLGPPPPSLVPPAERLGLASSSFLWIGSTLCTLGSPF